MNDLSDGFDLSTGADAPPVSDYRSHLDTAWTVKPDVSSAARAFLQEAATGKPTEAPVRVRLEAAAALYKASRLDAAEAVYRSVLEKRPDSYKALLGLGYLARDRGDQAAALAFFEAARTARPEKIGARLDAALALRKMSRLDEAEALYEGVLKEQPNQARALAGLGRVAEARGNIRSALASYHAAAAGNPDKQDLALKVASQLRKLSRLNEARRIYEDVLARKSDHDLARTRLRALGTQPRSRLPRMEASWLERPAFTRADEWGRNLEALEIPAFGLSLLDLAHDFAYGAVEEVRPDCILIRRGGKAKILPLVSDWDAFDQAVRREAAGLPPASLLGFVPERHIEGRVDQAEIVECHREYVYHRETVTQMAGSVFSQYRREIRSLLKRGAHVEPIGPSNLDRVLACNDRWFAGKQSRGRKTYYRGRTLWTFENLSLLEQLGVQHLALLLEEDVVGYAVCSHIGASWVIFTFRRGDREVRGVMPFLVSEMAKLYPGRQWINDGPAVRKPGLAWVKERLSANAGERQMKLGWLTNGASLHPDPAAEIGRSGNFVVGTT